MKLKFAIGTILVVASLIKLACLWGVIHWSWLERTAEEPMFTYFTPLLLIFVGVNLIYEGLNKKK